MPLNKGKFRLGACNLYIKEGVVPAFVLAGYVRNIKLTLSGHRSVLTGGQLGTTKADIVSTGAEAKIEGEFEEITLETWMRALRGNALLSIDDTTPTKRRVDFIPNAGQSMLALAQAIKIVPLVGGIETVNLEEIPQMPLAVTTGSGISIQYDWQNQAVVKFEMEALPDETALDRLIYWGDSTAVDAGALKKL